MRHRSGLALLVVAVLVVAVVTAPALFLVALVIPAASGTRAAPAYCFGYASDTPKILQTIRTVETGGNYATTITSSSASGAYAFLDSSWRHYAQLAGVDTAAYPRAHLAPPELQDRSAAVFANEILERHAGRISAIPVTWYIGHEPPDGSAEWDTVPTVGANTITPRQYVTKWMDIYAQVVAATTTPDQFCRPTSTPAPGGPLQPLIDAHGRSWSVPVAADQFNLAQLDDPHHDYPAWDLILPEGVPIHAVTDGIVVTERTWNDNWWRAGCSTGRVDCSTCGIGLSIQSDSGLRHIYCHNSALYVHQGDQVVAGQPVALSGDTGRSGTPHLHLEFRINGTRYCPQPIMQALYHQQPASLRWTTSGCST